MNINDLKNPDKIGGKLFNEFVQISMAEGSEIAGLNQIFDINEDFLILLSKLEGLKIVDTEFDFYDYKKLPQLWKLVIIH